MNEHTQRIEQIMLDKKMTPAEFSKAIGIKMSAMSHIRLGRNNPSANVITKIIKRFEDINPGWLLTGKGTMKIQTENQEYGLIDKNNQPSHQEDLSEDENEKKLTQLAKEQDLFNSQMFTGQFSDDTDINTIAPAVKTQPKLFEDANIRKRIIHSDEIRQATDVSQTENPKKAIEKEMIIYKEKAPKTIENLVIFYSDRTYESFVPEKKDFS